jgi:putative flippase GtrA
MGGSEADAAQAAGSDARAAGPGAGGGAPAGPAAAAGPVAPAGTAAAAGPVAPAQASPPPARDSLAPGPGGSLFVRLARSSRFVKFALVGVSGVFVNLGMLYVFADRLDWPELVSSAAAIEVSILWNFLLNNAFTFRDRNAGAKAGFVERLVRYNLVALVGLGLQLATFAALTAWVVRAEGLAEPGLYRYPAQLAGIALGMAWNFLTNFFWTWRQRPADAQPAAPAAAEDRG